MTAPTEAPAAIRGVRELVEPALRRSVGRLCAQMESVSGYHFGWWDEAGMPISAGGGKALRPALALLSAQATGAAPERGVPAAVAVELVHNFSLLHDDIMDGDTERRHRPTAWTIFGTSKAILAGDALLTEAVEVLLEAETAPACRAVRRLTNATQRLITGQTSDLDFETRNDVGLEECVRMASDKTAALLNCSSAIGAVLLGGDPVLCDGLAGFGEELGIAFQLVDDLLGIWGTTAATGKPVLADLRARKKSLPVVAALSSGTDAGLRLSELYTSALPLTEEELEIAAKLIEEAGGRRWAESEADRRYAAALAHLDRLPLPDHVREGFTYLARFIVERDR